VAWRPASGDLVTVNWDDDGTFGVAKILVTEQDGVHVRVYAERFSTRPLDVPNDLTLGTIHDASFGMGHLPLSWEDFEPWQAQYLAHAPVTDEDLEGYEMWREAAAEGHAGFFGTQPRRRTLWDRLRRR